MRRPQNCITLIVVACLLATLFPRGSYAEPLASAEAERQENDGSSVATSGLNQLTAQVAQISSPKPDAAVNNLAGAPANYFEIEKLTQEVLSKELAVLTFSSLIWREHLTRSRVWHIRRLCYRTFGQSLAFTGYLIQTAADFEYWQTPSQKPKYASFTGTLLRFIGKNEIIAAMTFERSLSKMKAERDKREGLDLKTTDGIVERLVHEANQLMLRRDKLIANALAMSQSERSVLAQEGTLLAGVRDQAILEYINLHARIVEKTWAQASADYLRIAKRLDGAYNANLIDIIREVDVAQMHSGASSGSGSNSGSSSSSGASGMSASSMQKPAYLGLSRAGSLGTLISGSMGMANPIIVYSGTLIGMRHSRKALEKRLGKPTITLAQFDADTHEYGSAVQLGASQMAPLAAKISSDNRRICEQTSSILKDMDAISRTERHRSHLRAIRLTTLRFLNSSTKVGRGVLKVIRDWDPYYYDPSRRDLISAYAAMIRLPSGALFLTDSLCEVGYEVLWHKQLAEKRIAPSRILAHRIETIESMVKDIDLHLKELGAPGLPPP